MAAATVITFSEYGEDAVLVTVRSLAEPRVETITRGWRATKIVTTAAAMVRVVAAKARPSRPRPTCQAAARAASTATLPVGARGRCAPPAGAAPGRTAGHAPRGAEGEPPPPPSPGSRRPGRPRRPRPAGRPGGR